MADTPVLEPFLSAGGRISTASVDALREAGQILEQKKKTAAPKVIAISASTGKNLIVKIWHPDHWLSSATYNPYHRRFRINAQRLREQGISAPVVRGWGKIGAGRTCFICYEALTGNSLRAMKPDFNLRSAAGFVAHLHDQGIDFRSLHMGNILQTANDQHSIIDVTDCRFYRRALAPKLRMRRLAYLFAHRRDSDFMQENDRWLIFFNAYCQAAGPAIETAEKLDEYQSAIMNMMRSRTVP